MVVSAPRPFREAIALWPGSLRLIALRMGVCVGFFVPAFLSARGAITKGPGSFPGDDASEISTVIQWTDGIQSLSDSSMAWWLFALVGFWFWDQLVFATAVSILKEPATGAPKVWRRLWSHGWPQLPALLRIAALAACVLGLGGAAINFVFEMLGDAGVQKGWGGVDRFLVVPGLGALTMAAWATFVGTLGFYTRLAVVARGRSRVRRAFPMALRIFLRFPRVLLAHVLMQLGLQILGGVLLLVTAPPAELAGGLVWGAYLLLHGFVWHYLLRLGSRVLVHPSLERVMDTPDEPFGLRSWLLGFFRKAQPDRT